MNKTFDRYASIVFLVIGAAFVMESMKISTSAYGSNVGPNIFPMGLGIILILLSIRLFIETRKYGSTQQKQNLDYKRFGIILVAAIFYGLLLETIGYVITTFLFLLIGFQVMEKGKILKSILISGGFSYGVYYLFVEVLDGSIPGFPIWFN